MARREKSPAGQAGRPQKFEEPVKFQLVMERSMRDALRVYAKDHRQDASEIIRELIEGKLRSPAKKR